MPKLLVTGANGLVGVAVAAMLAAVGRPFLALDVAASRYEAAADGSRPGFAVEAADLRDVHRLHALAREAGGFDAILHCGALSGPMVARGDPVRMHAVNVTGTVNLLELARIHAVPRLVFCSSVSAVGPTPPGVDPVPEAVPLAPTTVYGASKAAGEALAAGYAAEYGLDTVSLRIGWVYGPRRSTACDIRAMIDAAIAGTRYRREFGAATMRQYVHVDDVARALLCAAAVGGAGQRAYTVTGGDILSLAEIAAVVGDAVPGFVAEIGPGGDPGEDVQARFDISAAARDLGYRPRVAFADGIRDYVEHRRG